MQAAAAVCVVGEGSTPGAHAVQIERLPGKWRVMKSVSYPRKQEAGWLSPVWNDGEFLPLGLRPVSQEALSLGVLKGSLKCVFSFLRHKECTWSHFYLANI